MKYKDARPFADPKAAASELLKIYRGQIALRPDVGHTYTGVTNHEFIWGRGGNAEEHKAGVKYGVEAGWFRIDESGHGHLFLITRTPTASFDPYVTGMNDTPSDGIPTGWQPASESDHWLTCAVCGERFDMRKPKNIGEHIHDAREVEFVETFGPPTRRM